MLAYVCPPLPVPGLRENLHTWADIAVIVGVPLAVILLVLQWCDRQGRQATVNARIRTRALLAYRRLKPALGYQPDAAPEQRISARVYSLLGSLGEPMADMLTALAADAPEASRKLRRAVTEAYLAYWHARTLAESAEGGLVPDAVAQRALAEFERCATRLKGAAGPELLP
jgi:hypothetical protein